MSKKYKCEREKKLNMDSCRHLSDLLPFTSPDPSRTEHDRGGKNQRYHCWNNMQGCENSYHLYLSLILLTILSGSMLLEDKQQLKFEVVMTGISMVFLVVKWPRQAQIRRKTYKSRKKHQDRVQDAKRQEKTQKVKKYSIPSQHDVCYRATMKAPCTPSNQKK